MLTKINIAYTDSQPGCCFQSRQIKRKSGSHSGSCHLGTCPPDTGLGTNSYSKYIYICMAQKWSTTYDTFGKKVFDPYLLEPLKYPYRIPVYWLVNTSRGSPHGLWQSLVYTTSYISPLQSSIFNGSLEPPSNMCAQNRGRRPHAFLDKLDSPPPYHGPRRL